MIMFGIGELLGCFFIGYVVDKYGSRPAIYVNLAIMLTMGVVTMIYCIRFQFGFLAYVMCFMWGFQDSAINTHSQEILGFEFNNNSEPYSVYNILQCIACSLFQVIQISVYNQTSYTIYGIIVGILGLLCAGNTLRFNFREHQRKELMDLDTLEVD
jgi:predicted MFS family arabinose efflux permease